MNKLFFILIVFISLFFAACSVKNIRQENYGYKVFLLFERDGINYTAHFLIDQNDVNNTNLEIDQNYRSLAIMQPHIHSQNHQCSQIDNYVFLFKQGKYYVCGIDGSPIKCSEVVDFEEKAFSVGKLLNVLINYINSNSNTSQVELDEEVNGAINAKLIKMSSFDNSNFSKYHNIVPANSMCLEYFYHVMKMSRIFQN